MPAGDSGVFEEEAPGSFSPTDLLTLRLLKPLSQASFTSLSCEHLTNFPGLNFPEWARLDTQHALFEDTFVVLPSKHYGLDFGAASGLKLTLSLSAHQSGGDDSPACGWAQAGMGQGGKGQRWLPSPDPPARFPREEPRPTHPQLRASVWWCPPRAAFRGGMRFLMRSPQQWQPHGRLTACT